MYYVRKLSLVELGTHVEVAMVVRSSAHGEPAMVAGLFRHLTSEMLLLSDRGFFSYELWQQMGIGPGRPGWLPTQVSGKEVTSPPPPPLRTARESFPSCSSSLSNALRRTRLSHI